MRRESLHGVARGKDWRSTVSDPPASRPVDLVERDSSAPATDRSVHRLLEPIGNVPPAESEEEDYRRAAQGVEEILETTEPPLKQGRLSTRFEPCSGAFPDSSNATDRACHPTGVTGPTAEAERPFHGKPNTDSASSRTPRSEATRLSC